VPVDVDRVTKQLQSVVRDWHESHSTNGYLEDYDARRIMTRARAAIERLAPPGSPYAEDARGVLEKHETAADSWLADQLVAIVQALEEDYLSGGLAAVAEMVHADLFDDFWKCRRACSTVAM
jgi:hypothetical protein